MPLEQVQEPACGGVPQRTLLLSLRPPLAIRLPSPLMATQCTALGCPFISSNSRPVRASQTLHGPVIRTTDDAAAIAAERHGSDHTRVPVNREQPPLQLSFQIAVLPVAELRRHLAQEVLDDRVRTRFVEFIASSRQEVPAQLLFLCLECGVLALLRYFRVLLCFLLVVKRLVPGLQCDVLALLCYVLFLLCHLFFGKRLFFVLQRPGPGP